MLSHKTSVNEFKKTETISSIFTNHNSMKLEINYKEKKTLGKNTNTWRLNNMLLNNQWVNKEIKEELKKFMETNENNSPKSLGHSKAVLRETYTFIQAYLKKQEKYQIIKPYTESN